MMGEQAVSHRRELEDEGNEVGAGTGSYKGNQKPVSSELLSVKQAGGCPAISKSCGLINSLFFFYY